PPSCWPKSFRTRSSAALRCPVPRPRSISRRTTRPRSADSHFPVAAAWTLWLLTSLPSRLPKENDVMTFARHAAGLLALLLVLSPIAARSADPVVIKFSHIVATDTPKGMTADKFKELAEAMTGGRVKVEIYPNSTLYKDSEELAALQRGDVQILAPSISRLALLGAHEFEVFDLPF